MEKSPGKGRQKKPGQGRVFIGSAQAKTILNKIKAAEKALESLDKTGMHPKTPEYQRQLKQLKTQEYENRILYWQRGLEFAKANNADNKTISYFESNLAKAKKLWNETKKFLK